MGERSRALASQFEQANRELIAEVERCSDGQWKAECPGEGRSVGVVAHHVAASHATIVERARKTGAGEPLPPVTMDMIDQFNAQHALAQADCTKEETLALLRRNGDAAAAVVSDMSDEQLDRRASFADRTMTTQQIIERVLIGHVQNHVQSIRAAASAA